MTMYSLNPLLRVGYNAMLLLVSGPQLVWNQSFPSRPVAIPQLIILCFGAGQKKEKILWVNQETGKNINLFFCCFVTNEC